MTVHKNKKRVIRSKRRSPARKVRGRLGRKGVRGSEGPAPYLVSAAASGSQSAEQLFEEGQGLAAEVIIGVENAPEVDESEIDVEQSGRRREISEET